jgi:hypothetical protein
MILDTTRLGELADAIFADLHDDLRHRREVSAESRHFTTKHLPFTAFTSLGHDVAHPDEDIAVTIDVTPDMQRLVACIAWADGRILAEDEYPIASSDREHLEAAMGSARRFLKARVDMIANALAELD